EKVDLPLLVYDGDCDFCRRWIARWRAITGERVEYAPYQKVAGRFPQIPIEDFKRSVQLILPGGEIFAGAHAVFRTLALSPGRVGSHGMLPAADYLQAVRENFRQERYWLFPTLAWVDASDGFLLGLTVAGALLSILLVLGVASVPVLVLLWALYLSLGTVGQDFMMFQWDSLLSEIGFLAIFFAPLQLKPDLERER